jgi:C-terminal processing protease CtpA/Prc
MKLLVLLILFSAQSLAQTITVKQAKKLSKEIVNCIKQNSIFADSLDYGDIEKDFDQHIDTFNTYQKVGDYYITILRMTGDNHSIYINKKVLENVSQKQKDNIDFNYKLLYGNIGYLSIPGFLSTDNNVVNDFANQIHNAIRELDSKQLIMGWIIDLQNNTGGNMWPMVLGLHPLIGNEVPGYFKHANRKNPEKWNTNSPHDFISIKNPYQLQKSDTKIAVLYSKKTASSGEMTGICFIGKNNAKSFGTATAGYTTGNGIFYLSEGNIFVLASSYVLDRNKKMYKGSILPDVMIENADNNSVIEKAKLWLKE